jgi:hypothetical protein
MKHSSEITNPKLNAGIVLKRLAIETEGGHNWQTIEPFAAWVGGQAVEESVLAITDFEIEKRLCVGGVHGTLHGASSLGQVVRVILLCEMGDLRGAQVRVAATR